MSDKAISNGFSKMESCGSLEFPPCSLHSGRCSPGQHRHDPGNSRTHHMSPTVFLNILVEVSGLTVTGSAWVLCPFLNQLLCPDSCRLGYLVMLHGLK